MYLRGIIWEVPHAFLAVVFSFGSKTPFPDHPTQQRCHLPLSLSFSSLYVKQEGMKVDAELNQREEERGNSSQSWVENTNMTGCMVSTVAVTIQQCYFLH
jgi:hypothetical protein